MSPSSLAPRGVLRWDVIAVGGTAAARGLKQAVREVGEGGGGKVDVGAVAAVGEEVRGMLFGVGAEVFLREFCPFHADGKLPGNRLESPARCL